MSLAKMEKIRLVGHETERERVLAVLQDLGVVQITDLTKEDPQTIPGFAPKQFETNSLESTLTELRYTLDFIARYDQEKRGFIQGFFNLRDSITTAELAQLAQSYDYGAVCEQARRLDRELLALRSEKTQLETRRTELTPWAALPIPLESLQRSARTTLLLGRLPKAAISVLEETVQSRLDGLAVIERLFADEQSVYIYVILPKESEEDFLKIASERSWERISFQSLPPDASGSIKAWLTRTEQRLQEIAARQRELDRQAESIVAQKRKLQALYDYCYNEQLKLSSQKMLMGSANAFVLGGWIRANDYAKLERALQQASEAVWLERVQPGTDERPPAALENRALFQPAEFLIRLFGLPHRGELDPTPFVLPFFAVFFGIALTDAGYGLVLVSAFWVLKLKYRHKLGFQSFANLMMLGGFAAIIAGAFTGGWFGPELAQSFAWLRALMLFDVSTPAGLIAFLLFSFALGFAQVFLGNALEFYDKARQGRFWEGLWSEGSWLVFMVGLGIMAGVGVPAIMPKELNAPGLPQDWMPIGAYLALVGTFLVLFFSRAESPQNLFAQAPWLLLALGLTLWLQRPLAALPLGEILTALGLLGIFFTTKIRAALGRIGAGAFKLYGATGLLGDVLSYSRIMALGVSTGLIAASMNKLSLMTWELPFVGPLICIVLIALLQTFSILINSLSAFVHSARLHYVEFFTKFYEAGGEAFKPFARESVYYEVQQKR